MAPGSIEQLFEERIDRDVAEMVELCVLAADPEQRALVKQQWRGVAQILLRAKLILAILDGEEIDQIKRLIVSLDLRSNPGQLKMVSNVLSGRKIRAGDQWDCDHAVALINGGEHREYNLVPVLRDKHREKTAQDVAEKSRVYRKRAKFIGVELRKGPKLQGRPFEKRAPQRTATRPIERRT